MFTKKHLNWHEKCHGFWGNCKLKLQRFFQKIGVWQLSRGSKDLHLKKSKKFSITIFFFKEMSLFSSLKKYRENCAKTLPISPNLTVQFKIEQQQANALHLTPHHGNYQTNLSSRDLSPQDFSQQKHWSSINEQIHLRRINEQIHLRRINQQIHLRRINQQRHWRNINQQKH